MRLHYLNQFMISNNCEYDLETERILIDGDNYFHGLYKKSGCEYLLGGEYDRFAEFIYKNLFYFKDAQNCFVIFKSQGVKSIKDKIIFHQIAIDHKRKVDPLGSENDFVRPAFFFDVIHEVLNKLGIDYYYSNQYSFDLINMARHFRCLLITQNNVLNLFGVPCFRKDDVLSYNPDTKKISVKIYKTEKFNGNIRLDQNKLPIFLALLDLDNFFIGDLKSVINYTKQNLVMDTLRWVRCHQLDNLLSVVSKNLSQTKYLNFMKQYAELNLLLEPKDNTPCINYFLKRSDKTDWFEIGCDNKVISSHYLNLKYKNMLRGSWLIYDEEKEDSILLSIEIIQFAHQLLTDFQKSSIILIGRKRNTSTVFSIAATSKFDKLNIQKACFDRGWSNIPDYFNNFLKVSIGFEVNDFSDVPDQFKLVMITLVYYSLKKSNETFAKPYSCCVILSCIFLGLVTEVTGLIDKSNIKFNSNQSKIIDNCTMPNKEDCSTATTAFMELFYAKNIGKIFDRSVLHLFAEFKHCLQEMNSLNRLCGEKVPCTVYHKCMNGTFIYNMFMELKGRGDPVDHVKILLQQSPSIATIFTDMCGSYDRLISKCIG